MKELFKNIFTATAVIGLLQAPTGLRADEEPITQLDPAKTLHIVVEVQSDDFSAGPRQIDFDELDAYAYLTETFEKALKEKYDYPGEIKFQRWPSRLDSEDNQILEISLVEWRTIRGFNEINARFFATLKSYTGTEKLKLFKGDERASISPSFDRTLERYKDALREGIDELYEQLKVRLPQSEYTEDTDEA